MALCESTLCPAYIRAQSGVTPMKWDPGSYEKATRTSATVLCWRTFWEALSGTFLASVDNRIPCVQTLNVPMQDAHTSGRLKSGLIDALLDCQFAKFCMRAAGKPM